MKSLKNRILINTGKDVCSSVNNPLRGSMTELVGLEVWYSVYDCVKKLVYNTIEDTVYVKVKTASTRFKSNKPVTK